MNKTGDQKLEDNSDEDDQFFRIPCQSKSATNKTEDSGTDMRSLTQNERHAIIRQQVAQIENQLDQTVENQESETIMIPLFIRNLMAKYLQKNEEPDQKTEIDNLSYEDFVSLDDIADKSQSGYSEKIQKWRGLKQLLNFKIDKNVSKDDVQIFANMTEVLNKQFDILNNDEISQRSFYSESIKTLRTETSQKQVDELKQQLIDNDSELPKGFVKMHYFKFIRWVYTMHSIQSTKKVDTDVDDISENEDTKTEDGNFIGTIWDYPEDLRDNFYIITGYRCGYKGFWGGFKTLFMWHNETVNVWTHFIGKLVTFATIAYLLVCYHEMGLQGFEFQNTITQMETKSEFNLQSYIELQINDIDQSIEDSKKETNFNLNQIIDKIEGVSFGVVEFAQDKLPQVTTQDEQSVHKLTNSLNLAISKYITVLGTNDTYSTKRLETINKALTELDIFYADAKTKMNTLKQDLPSYDIKSILDPSRVLNYIPRWPLFIHLAGLVICLGLSAIYHLFRFQGKKCEDQLATLDYGGICILIMGSAYPPSIYPFACQPLFAWSNSFLSIITVTSLFAFAALNTPPFQKTECRAGRALLFIALGISAAAPLFFLTVFDAYENQMSYFAILPWVYGGLMYGLTAGIYATQYPEKLFKRKFDIIGSSHQIFHCGVLAGATIHFLASLQLYEKRQNFVCPIYYPEI